MSSGFFPFFFSFVAVGVICLPHKVFFFFFFFHCLSFPSLSLSLYSGDGSEFFRSSSREIGFPGRGEGNFGKPKNKRGERVHKSSV
ncbi:hypothetical protein F5X99DRAFT_373496 [Biscogniauxia marginata]|nr:hypothetical protein F5X99DRAFT_373496 [Biscogniauxia marginata]